MYFTLGHKLRTSAKLMYHAVQPTAKALGVSALNILVQHVFHQDRIILQPRCAHLFNTADSVHFKNVSLFITN